MKKTMFNTIAFICIILLGWVAWSFVDIVSDNNTMNLVHSNINFFALIS